MERITQTISCPSCKALALDIFEDIDGRCSGCHCQNCHYGEVI